MIININFFYIKNAARCSPDGINITMKIINQTKLNFCKNNA